jgi:hypothetical protein
MFMVRAKWNLTDVSGVLDCQALLDIGRTDVYGYHHQALRDSPTQNSGSEIMTEDRRAQIKREYAAKIDAIWIEYEKQEQWRHDRCNDAMRKLEEERDRQLGFVEGDLAGNGCTCTPRHDWCPLDHCGSCEVLLFANQQPHVCIMHPKSRDEHCCPMLKSPQGQLWEQQRMAWIKSRPYISDEEG